MKGNHLILTIGCVAFLLSAAPHAAFAKDPVNADQIRREHESAKEARNEEERAQQRDALRSKLRKLMKARAIEAQYQGDVHELDSNIEDVKDDIRRQEGEVED